MLNEDTETAETGADDAPADAGQAEVSAEPIETAEAAPEAEAAEPAPEIEVPEIFEWNGEMESMQSEAWYQNLDDNLRQAVLKGIEGKYQNWQRGYTAKFQALAKQRRETDEKLKTVRDQELRVQRWLHGDIDPMVEKQRELDELTIAHKSALKALRDEAEAAHEKTQTSHGTELLSAQQARDEAIEQSTQLQAQLDQIDAKQTEAQVDHLESWLTTEAKDIYDNDEAVELFCKNFKAGVEPSKAVTMVRALYPVAAPEPEPAPAPAPAPEPAPEPEPVPDGMKLMNMGPDTVAATEGSDPRSYDEMMEGLRKTAMREQEILLNG